VSKYRIRYDDSTPYRCFDVQVKSKWFIFSYWKNISTFYTRIYGMEGARNAAERYLNFVKKYGIDSTHGPETKEGG